jgi:hypothetical protein
MFRLSNFLKLFSVLIILPFISMSCSESDDDTDIYGKYTVAYYDRDNEHIPEGFLYSIRTGEREVIELPDFNNYYSKPRGRNDFSFIGWKDTNDVIHSATNYTVTSDMEFNAVWQANFFNVVAYKEDDINEIDNLSVARGGSYKLPAPDSRPGIFLGWSSSYADPPRGTLLLAEGAVVSVEKDIKYYQVWIDLGDTFSVGFLDASTSGTYGNWLDLDIALFNAYTKGANNLTLLIDTLDITAFTLPGIDNFSISHINYKFDGWYLFNTGERYPADYEANLFGFSGHERYFYAHWEPDSPLNPPGKVKAYLYDDGVLIGALEDYPVNFFNIPNNITRRGYGFNGWAKDTPSAAGYDYTGTSVAVDTKFYAKFELLPPKKAISDADELSDIRTDLDGSYELTADITLPGAWIPIGTADAPFTGILAGNGHMIDGLNIDYTNLPDDQRDSVGLFGVIDNGSRIDDLTIKVDSITGNSHAGGVAGIIRSSGNDVTKIVDVRVVKGNAPGSITVNGSDEAYAGGIAGYQGSNVSVISSTNEADINVTGKNAYGGGISGYAQGSVIGGSPESWTENSGKITVTATEEGYGGGIAGRYNASEPLAFARNTGAVTVNDSGSGAAYAGGIFGYGGQTEDCSNNGQIYANGSGNGYTYAGGVGGHTGGITRCYNAGAISSEGASLTYAGGLGGYAENSVNNSYNTDTGSVSAVSTRNYRAYAGGITGAQNGGYINRTYNLGATVANSSGGSIYAGGILGGMLLDTVIVGNVAANGSVNGTTTSTNKKVNRILGGTSGVVPLNSADNFANSDMSSNIAGSFTPATADYYGTSKSVADLQITTTYSDTIASGGLGFSFCGTPDTDCNVNNREEFPWQAPDGSNVYKYPILYWQDDVSSF